MPCWYELKENESTAKAAIINCEFNRNAFPIHMETQVRHFKVMKICFQDIILEQALIVNQTTEKTNFVYNSHHNIEGMLFAETN